MNTALRLIALILSAFLWSPAMADPPPDPHADARQRMIERHLKGRDISDPHVLRAMAEVPRHAFVPADRQERAYGDHPLPIGHDQTISQPYIVALMTQLGGAKPGQKALDVGTGSGYQAAVLAAIVDHVYSVEIVCPLAETARQRLKQLDIDNVTVECRDGYRGWPEHAPFDVIVLAAAAPKVPQPLLDQLKTGGRLVLPVGDVEQTLIVVKKGADGAIETERHGGVRFVPMTGAVRGDEEKKAP
jgi:protein-L-isoaspartate(D-aspartate) O-methyltransferase